jgi:putative SOS response-associated peptidase YedK
VTSTAALNQKPGAEEWMRSFAVITTTELVSDIHDRMPVIVPSESYDRWLSAVEPDPRDLLVPFPAALMTMWPTRVNKPDNDDPGC